MRSSPSLDNLFAAAREDAPAPEMRDQVWGKVAAITAAPAGAAAAKVAAPAGAKLLAAGAVLGAVSTAVVAIMLFSARAPSEQVLASTVGSTQATATSVLAAPEEAPPPASASPPARESATATAPPARVEEPKEQTPSEAHVTATASAAAPAVIVAKADEGSGLAKEAALVTEARMALVRGEPERALVLVRSTRRLPARALEPEELALEARALRALGRTDEALATELTLRHRFPDHALSR